MCLMKPILIQKYLGDKQSNATGGYDMNSSKVVKLIAVVLLMGIQSFGEYRIWTDANGSAIEAEFQGIDGDNIVLTTREGKTFKVSPVKLSLDDQSFLKGKIPDDLLDPTKSVSVLDREKPPTFQIKVSKNTDTVRTNWDWVERDVIVKATLKKTSMQPYSGTMKATLYTLGRAKYDDFYVMLDVKDFTFDFNTSREVEIESDSSRVRYYKSYNYGIEFEGYVVIITDQEGNELGYEASDNKLRDSRNKLAEFKRDDVFNKRFKSEGRRSGRQYYY